MLISITNIVVTNFTPVSAVVRLQFQVDTDSFSLHLVYEQLLYVALPFLLSFHIEDMVFFLHDSLCEFLKLICAGTQLHILYR